MSGFQMFLRQIYWKVIHWSPIVWTFILIVVALILIRLDTDFTKKMAILPTVIAILLFYQAIFRKKMY